MAEDRKSLQAFLQDLLERIKPAAASETSQVEDESLIKPQQLDDDSCEQLSPVDLLATLGLALFGYLYLLLFPLLSLLLLGLAIMGAAGVSGLTGWGVWLLQLLLGLFCGGIAFLLYNSALPVRRVRPLHMEQAPELFELLGQYREEFKLPVIDQILLTDQYDITLLRRPQLFLPIWHSYDLHLGLPLMQLLSQEQFKTLLLREFGHLKWRNGLLGWLYHLRTIWPCYAQLSPGRWRLQHYLLVVFFSRFSPLYNRLSRSVVRAEQRAADTATLDMVSDLDLVDALAARVVGETYLQRRYWPSYLALANRTQKPPFLPFSKLETHSRKELNERQCNRWLRRAYHTPLDGRMVQPTLRDRLVNIGHIALPAGITLVRISAAEHYLGAGRAEVIEQVGELWLLHNHQRWKLLYGKGLKERRELKQLHQRQQQGETLPPQDGWRLATLIERHIGLAKALPYYRRLLKQSPDDARLNFNIGRLFYLARDPATVSVLERAMLLNNDYNDAATQLITRFKSVQRVKKEV